MYVCFAMATNDNLKKLKHSTHSTNYIKDSVKISSDLDVNCQNYIPQHLSPSAKHNSEKNIKT